MKTNKNNIDIVGTGLVCLDIIKGEKLHRYYNGGSCGNVTAALSFLGWRSTVVTRNYMDFAGTILKTNLNNIGVKQITFGRNPTTTPRIIEELIVNKGQYKEHKFNLECSRCGKQLPKVKLFKKENAPDILRKIENIDVFYTDRASSGISYLREIVNELGGWTIYEPNSSRNILNVIKNSYESSIVKFSSEKFSFNIVEKIRTNDNNSSMTLIIYTKGEKGLIFSYRKKDKKLSNWISLDAQPTTRVIDTAGAGDWCTAGVLYALVEKYKKYRRWISKNDAIAALQFGQAIAAISCAFVGGQGLVHADFDQKDIREMLLPIKKERLVKVSEINIKKENTIEYCDLCLSPI